MKKTIIAAAVILMNVIGASGTNKVGKTTIDGVCYTAYSDGTAEAAAQSKKISSATVKDQVTVKDRTYIVTALPHGAFSKCRKLKRITLPYTLRKIGSTAFSFCESLEKINIPSSVTAIEGGTFIACMSLKSITIPESVRTIGGSAFFSTGITSIEIPASVSSIAADAFAGKTTVSDVTFATSSQRDKFSDRFPKAVLFTKDVHNGSSALAQNSSSSSVSPPARPSNDTTTGSNMSGTVPSASDRSNSTGYSARGRQTAGSDVDRDIPTASRKSENTFAVIIANENYNREVSVPYAGNDGSVFAEYCTTALGLPKSNIRLVRDATLNDIRHEVGWITGVMNAYGGEAKVIFYYAGHGIPDESSKSAYLLPVDGYGSDTRTGYSLEELYGELGRCPAESVTVFLDACFSGAKREGDMLASARGVAVKVNPTAPVGNMVVFSASTGDETAYPYNEQGHGMFTYYLLKKLQETSGDVTLGELGDYVTTQVMRQSIVINSKSQTPTVIPSSSMTSTWRSETLK